MSILSDHGICVSFDEEVSKRRSSSLLCTGNYTLLSDQQHRSITVKLPLEMNGEHLRAGERGVPHNCWCNGYAEEEICVVRVLQYLFLMFHTPPLPSSPLQWQTR